VTVTFLNPDYPLKLFRDQDYDLLHRFCKHITVYSDKDDGALGWSEWGNRARSLGRMGTPIVRTPGTSQYLDIDLIDSSALQDNMHSMRHSAFNVNRVLVEDLREGETLS